MFLEFGPLGRTGSISGGGSDWGGGWGDNAACRRRTCAWGFERSGRNWRWKLIGKRGERRDGKFLAWCAKPAKVAG